MTVKTILFFLCHSAACHTLSAQDSSALNVIYKFTYIRDLVQQDNPYLADMVLSIAGNTSHYSPVWLYDDNVRNGSLVVVSRQQPIQVNTPSASVTVVTGGPMLRVGRSGVVMAEEILKDFGKGKLEVDGDLTSRTYVVEANMPQIDWELKSETKVIGGYTCQKAMGSYAGRRYEVWFTKDLPFHDGPWKLNGLPGLILEGRDTANQVAFRFSEIRKNPDTRIAMASFLRNPRSISTNLKSYRHLRAAYDSDPEGIILAEHPDARIHIAAIDGSGLTTVNRIKKYNPIEAD